MDGGAFVGGQEMGRITKEHRRVDNIGTCTMTSGHREDGSSYRLRGEADGTSWRVRGVREAEGAGIGQAGLPISGRKRSEAEVHLMATYNDEETLCTR